LPPNATFRQAMDAVLAGANLPDMKTIVIEAFVPPPKVKPVVNDTPSE
jgi:hypothetical protein